MKHIILGTAGHIDHGKTSLIKALTGVDCDRLKEEKLRGITIELGYTYFDLPNTVRLGIIDVPGHEKFVHHMVAGVVGMDMVLLVIAADEGVMPQTKEHLDICRILGVQRGLVVLTKTDLVDSEWLELMTEEIKEFVQGTFLGASPVIPVSSATGEGLDALIGALSDLAETVPARGKEGIFRLPIDRVFIMKGFGTVVTGTILSGEVKSGDTVEIFPRQIQCKVRGLQVHNDKVDSAMAGQRCAINLQGIDREEIQRGDMICQPNILDSSYLLDARLTLLENSKPLKNRCRIRLHTGTAEILGRVILLDRDTLDPGDTCFVQFRLEEKMAVMSHDRYVIRTYSPLMTSGGGEIIENHPEKHKRYKTAVMDEFTTLERSSIAQIVEFYIKKSGAQGIGLKKLVGSTNGDSLSVKQILDTLHKEGKVLSLDDMHSSILHNSVYKELQREVKEAIEKFHANDPLQSGISKEELKTRISPDLEVKWYNRVLEDLEKEGSIVHKQQMFALASHTMSLSPEEKKDCEKILSSVKRAGLQPPPVDEILSAIALEKKRGAKFIDFLVREGNLIRLKEGIIFHRDIVDQLINQVQGFLQDGRRMDIGDFKDMTGLSRKFAVPLLEYLDDRGITMRVADKRVLRKKV